MKLQNSVGDLELPENKKEIRQARGEVGWKMTQMHRTAPVAKQYELELIWYRDMNDTRRSGTC